MEMYTVGQDQLPPPDFVDEAVDLMIQCLAECHSPLFEGEVYTDTKDSTKFSIALYGGKIVSLSLIEPPSFTISVNSAEQQTAACDCPYTDVDILRDLPQAIREAELSKELDEFAGIETHDPHFEDLDFIPGSEISIRFDRLGGYGVVGSFAPLQAD